MKKLVLSILLVMFIMIAAVGCGSQSAEEAEQPEAAAEETTAEETTAEEATAEEATAEETTAEEATAETAEEAAPAGGELSLAGKKIGVAVIGTDHNWDRQAFQGALDMIEALGGEAVTTNAERNDQKHVSDLENLLAQDLDAIINILGTGEVLEPVFKKISEAGVPLFTIDTPTVYSLNNSQSDNYQVGSTLARTMAEDIGGEGKIAVFNGFYGIRVCGIRYDELQQVLKDYPNIEIIEPELQDVIPNTIEDARKKVQDLLVQYGEGEIDAVWSCWDVPSIGANQAIVEAGREDNVYVYGIDGDPTVLEIMAAGDSAIKGDMAQQPYLIGQKSVENVARYFAGAFVPANTYVEPYLVTPENVEAISPILFGTSEEREAALAAMEENKGSGVDLTGLSLEGMKIGVAVIGTDHAWDRQAFQGVIDVIEALGGEAVTTNAERNDQKHVSDLENLLAQDLDAIVNILGTGEVLEPVFQKISEAGVPLFTVDTPTVYSLNNTQSDNYLVGSTLARTLAEDIGGEGKIAVFNGFYGIRVCGIRYDQLQQVLKDYPNIEIIEPELQDVIPNTIEDARKKIQDLLVQYGEGEIDAVWSCWDVPSIGANQAIVEADRQDNVYVYGIDGDATVLEIMAAGDSALKGDMAQQPYLIGQTSGANVARYLAGAFVPANTYVEPYLATPENVDDVRVILGQVE